MQLTTSHDKALAKTFYITPFVEIGQYSQILCHFSLEFIYFKVFTSPFFSFIMQRTFWLVFFTIQDSDTHTLASKWLNTIFIFFSFPQEKLTRKNMDKAMTKLGSFWVSKKAKEEISHITNDLSVSLFFLFLVYFFFISSISPLDLDHVWFIIFFQIIIRIKNTYMH